MSEQHCPCGMPMIGGVCSGCVMRPDWCGCLYRGTDFSGDALEQVHRAYLGWFGRDYDTGALDVVLCAARAEKLPGDPPWVLNVAGSGCAKTETITPLGAAGARMVSMLSGEAALLSGTPQNKRAEEATGGLLREIGSSGLLVIKDFTSVLSMHRDTRAKVISALREIHDGHWVRDVGTDGGMKIPWSGRIVIIGACTTAWDAHREVVASMGDRFLVVRQRTDRLPAGRKAIGNHGSERQMREQLGAAVRETLARPLAGAPPEIGDDGDAGLLALADLVTRCRTRLSGTGRATPRGRTTWRRRPGSPSSSSAWPAAACRWAWTATPRWPSPPGPLPTACRRNTSVCCPTSASIRCPGPPR